MLSMNLTKDEIILNLHSYGEGVLYYASFNRETQEADTTTYYLGDVQTADEKVVTDAADLIEMGWRLA